MASFLSQLGRSSSGAGQADAISATLYETLQALMAMPGENLLAERYDKLMLTQHYA